MKAGSAFPLSRRAVFSRGFLDALADAVGAWSAGLFDESCGGFRQNDQVGCCVLSTTDVVWLRYATGAADPGAPDREAVIGFLGRAQDPRTGKVPHGPGGQGHCDGHAFWQTVRALNILGGALPHPPRFLRPVLTPAGLAAWFDRFDWSHGGDGHHHEVLGLVPVLATLADDAWAETFFGKIGQQQDPDSGAWPRGRCNISRTFAYTALHLAAGQLPARAERVVDVMLRLQRDDGLWDGPPPGFHTMDAIYLLARLPRRLGHRRAEASAALGRAAGGLREAFAAHQQTYCDNPHRMLSVVHAFGLLQEALPEAFAAARTYRFDWDRPALYGCEALSAL